MDSQSATAVRESPASTPPRLDASTARRAVLAASLGNALEWYDFSVYAFFASFIAAGFFATHDPAAALLETFVVFGVGFVARPIGALLLGAQGDRRGRKTALTTTILLMGAGTLVVAVAPPYAAIGVGAPALLLLGRLLQGFSAGGEIGGAAAYLVEQAPPARRGAYASWLQASMGVSNLLAALVGLGVTTAFSDATTRAWAWRLPFLLGLLIVPVGLYVRRHMPETAAISAVRDDDRRHPLRRLVVDHPRELLVGTAFCIAWTVSVYTLIIFLPTYYGAHASGLGFRAHDGFLASLVGNVAMVAGCLLSGRLLDALGARRVLTAACVALAVVPWAGLLWLHASPSLPVLLAVHTLMCAAMSTFAGAAPSVLPAVFPAEVRSSGVAVTYNVASILLAGFTPAILTWATAHVSVYAPAGWVTLAALAGLAALPSLLRLTQQH